MINFLENVQWQLQKTANILKISPEVLKNIQQPNRILQFSIPIKRANGQMEAFPAFRIQHSNLLGPYKGGILFSPEVNVGQIKALAEIMTWKTSLVGLPFGGAKGGIRVDPERLSRQELEELSRGYIKGIFNFLGPQVDIPAPDINTNPQIIAWMIDEFSLLKGEFVPAAFTGKPLNISGSKGRDVAAAYGGAIILKEIIKDFFPNQLNNSPTVALQGFGKIGKNLARILQGAGFNIVALADKTGGIRDFQGKKLDIDKIIQCIKGKNSLIDCYCHNERCFKASKNQQINNEDLLKTEVDILILAAVEEQIHKDNAEHIQAKIVLEIANGAINYEGENILAQRDILIVPDILAGAGGVIASYLEWFQNIEESYWPEEQVLERTERMLLDAYESVKNIALERRVSLKEAARIKAIERLARQLNLKKARQEI
jgi:glutamate dehydrogenase/leucine dehydrogenase